MISEARTDGRTENSVLMAVTVYTQQVSYQDEIKVKNKDQPSQNRQHVKCHQTEIMKKHHK